MDCDGCDSWRTECEGGLAVEFLGVEFARDVEYVTVEYPTTQENVLLGYVKHLAVVPYAIVFNTGLHDTTLSDETHDYYSDAIKWYANLVRQTVRSTQTQVYWLSTSSVNANRQPLKWRSITFNSLIERMNAAASVAVHAHGFAEMDQYALSLLRVYSPHHTRAAALARSTPGWPLERRHGARSRPARLRG